MSFEQSKDITPVEFTDTGESGHDGTNSQHSFLGAAKILQHRVLSLVKVCHAPLDVSSTRRELEMLLSHTLQPRLPAFQPEQPRRANHRQCGRTLA